MLTFDNLHLKHESEAEMYERFTDRARFVMQLANQIACRFDHDYIGTEHILLGIIKECSGLAIQILRDFGIDPHKIKADIEREIQTGPEETVTELKKLPQTPRAKKVTEYALDESRHLRQNYVCSEHLLLGLLDEGEGLAGLTLKKFGLNADIVRARVINMIMGNTASTDVRSLTDELSTITGKPQLEALQEAIKAVRQQKHLTAMLRVVSGMVSTTSDPQHKATPLTL